MRLNSRSCKISSTSEAVRKVGYSSIITQSCIRELVLRRQAHVLVSQIAESFHGFAMCLDNSIDLIFRQNLLPLVRSAFSEEQCCPVWFCIKPKLLFLCFHRLK